MLAAITMRAIKTIARVLIGLLSLLLLGSVTGGPTRVPQLGQNFVSSPNLIPHFEQYGIVAPLRIVFMDPSIKANSLRARAHQFFQNGLLCLATIETSQVFFIAQAPEFDSPFYN